MRILVTGGAGFIGSAVCRQLTDNEGHFVANLDCLTYAGNLESLKTIEGKSNYRFYHGSIDDVALVSEILFRHEIEGVMHLAAESHVDRSIEGPGSFIETNIVGTYKLLNATLAYWQSLPSDRQRDFRFHQVSTDEVYGDLPYDEGLFTEESAYATVEVRNNVLAITGYGREPSQKI